MTAFLVMTLAFLSAYGVYLAALVARRGPSPEAFLGGGANLPGWAVVFAGSGLVVAGLGLGDQLALTARFGLQASHLGMGLVLAAMTAILVQKRLWLAARITGLATPGELLARYYQSVTLRIVMLTLAGMFALPYAANLLSQGGDVVDAATAGAIGRAPAVWVLAFFLFLPAATGGWRGTVLVAATQAVLMAVLMLVCTLFAQTMLAGPGFPTLPLPVAEGILADRIPGVIQFSAGLGKSLPLGGIFTAVGIASTALSMIGVVLAPGFLYLGMTARAGRSMGFGAVWIVAGLGGAALLIGGPILAAHMGGSLADLAATMALVEPFAGLGLILMAVLAVQLAVGVLVNAGTILITQEMILPYVLPGQAPEGQRKTARIGLAVAYAVVAFMASFTPLCSAILAGLALPLAVQMLPALLGLCFVRWISSSAVVTGLILGGLMVVFTEPSGLILIEGLFGNLPWGRWPLTVHSAAWGFMLNVAAVLLVSIFTKSGAERAHRDRLHDEFAATWPVDFGGSAARRAMWSLTLIWAFLALGPGAILGNTFFSQPIFTEGQAALGLPSLWVWQIFFWLIGVPLVWWIAYRSKLGVTSEEGLRRVDLGGVPDPNSAPDWIATSLSRVTNLSRVTGR